MSATRTVSDLISEVRSMIDEVNEEALDDTLDILPALNRAQSYAYNILARRYVDPLLTTSELSLTSGIQEYDLPEDCFEDRILQIEIKVGTGSSVSYVPCTRISYRDVSVYDSPAPTPTPYYYAVVGRKIRFIPAPSGTYPARLWYVKDPEKLVKPQGRITLVNSASNYVLVNEVGEDLTTEVDELNSYVNVIDGHTGEIKGSLQIQSFTTDKITFKSTPSRTSVLNREILGDLSLVDVSPDDYLATVHGTCVAYFQDATSNFILSYAAFQMQSKLGVATGQESQLVEKFENQLEKQWTGRETTFRIKQNSKIFSPPYRNTRNRRPV